MPWFRYPAGYDNINVETQDFGVDHKDRDGNQYFQAPDRLTPSILAVPGFQVVSRPADAPPTVADITPQAAVDPMMELSGQVEAHRLQNQTLTDQINQLTAENADLKSQVQALQTQVTQLSPKGPLAEDVEPASTEDLYASRTQSPAEGDTGAESHEA